MRFDFAGNDSVIDLGEDFVSCFGGTAIRYIDANIFRFKYYKNCYCCGYCKDECCSYGVDVDIENVNRLLAYADRLEAYAGINRERWFDAEVVCDSEYAGGAYRRTRVVDGKCIFLNREQNGCRIHSFCIDNLIDFHSLKPVVSCLFPVTFDRKILRPSEEVETAELVCLSDCGSLYEGVRNDLGFYFGEKFLSIMDSLSMATSARR